jgi:hypothetical protein
VNLAEFCALATEHARRHDPDFPRLKPSGLVLVETWYAETTHESDQRTAGRGWLLRVEVHYLGPGDVCREDEWTAIAEGLGVPLTLCCVDGTLKMQ